jgi:hypothetical protein
LYKKEAEEEWDIKDNYWGNLIGAFLRRHYCLNEIIIISLFEGERKKQFFIDSHEEITILKNGHENEKFEI